MNLSFCSFFYFAPSFCVFSKIGFLPSSVSASMLCICLNAYSKSKSKGNVPQTMFYIVVGSENSQYSTPKKCNEDDFKASKSIHEWCEHNEIGNTGTVKYIKFDNRGCGEKATNSNHSMQYKVLPNRTNAKQKPRETQRPIQKKSKETFFFCTFRLLRHPENSITLCI